MMKFSRGDKPNSALEGCPEEFRGAVAAFFKSLETLPSHQMLLVSGTEQRIKKRLIEVVTEEVSNTSKKAVQIKADLITGKYDDQIFCDDPQLSIDLSIMASKHPRDFVETLFCKCKSEKQIKFWMQHLPLPRDALALAVHLGNNIHVLRYLNEKGCFENIYPNEKEEFLKRARRFDNEGFSYLKERLSLSSVVKLS